MKNKNSKVVKVAHFFITINFEVMETIRNQLKYSIGVQLPMILQKELRTAGIQFFMRLQKEQQRQHTKNQLKLGRKSFRNRKAILWPSK